MEIMDLALWLLIAFAGVSNFRSVANIELVQQKNAELRAKIVTLEKNFNDLSLERYDLYHEIALLEIKLKDPNFWSESRSEYEQLNTKFIEMKRQQTETEFAHHHELNQVRQECDELKEQNPILLAAATAAITASDVTLRLRYQTALLSKKLSDIDRIETLLEINSSRFALRFKLAISTLATLSKDRAKAEEHIAGLERDLEEANKITGEMWEKYLMSFVDKSEEMNKNDKKQEEESSDVEKTETSWLRK